MSATAAVSAELQTRAHIMRVQEILTEFGMEILRRGVEHDKSKFTPEEMGPLQAELEHQAEHGRAAYGTLAYEEARARLEPMLAHHYSRNDHHPEFYEDGVMGMDLFALVEMVADWKAASERGEESAINLTASAERFGIPEPLVRIIQNTLDNQGYAYT